MNIGMIINAPYPWDVRINKEATALIRAGFNVFLLCLRRKDEAYEEVIDGIRLTRIDAGTTNFQLALYDARISLTMIHPVFERAIKKWAIQNSIDVLHVHDLPLVATAIRIKQQTRIPVVADFHENYPDALETWFRWKRNPIVRLKNFIFMNPNRWRTLEAFAVRHADYVIAVVEEMKDRLIRNYQVDGSTILVVTNSEEKKFVNQLDDPTVYSEDEGKFILAYSGGIGPHRGIDTAIRGMQFLKSYPDIVFNIIGSGSADVMKRLKDLTNRLELTNQVRFWGYKPPHLFYSYMKHADVNVIPHESTGHTDHTIPHKIFQGMMVGKPLLVSSSPPLKRTVVQAGSGLVFEAGNAEDFAEKVLELYQNLTLREKLGSNGKTNTCDGTMNWETTQRILIDFYSNLNVPPA